MEKRIVEKPGAEKQDTENKDVKKPNMEMLPSELVSVICRWLPSKDLSNFRLTSRRYGSIGAIHFTKVHLMFLSKSFQNLNMLSKQPYLRKGVQEIFYEGGLLQAIDESDWEYLARRDSRDAVTPEQLKYAHDKYEEALDELVKLSKSVSNDRVLTEAFRNLPNLKSVDLVLDDKRREYSEAMKAAFSPTRVLPGILFYHPAYRSKFQSESGEIEFAGLLFALARAGTKLERLKVKKLAWGSLDCLSPHKELLLPVFQGLKHLSLHFRTQFLERSGYGYYLDFSKALSERQSILGEAIRMAEGLESLTVESYGSKYWGTQRESPPVVFNTLVGQMKFPRLKKLKLITLETDENFLFDFIFRHASTLKYLYLAELWLTEGSWESTFQKMHLCLDLECFGVGPQPFVNGNDTIDGGLPETVVMGTIVGDGRYLALGDKAPLNQKIIEWFMAGGVDPFLDKAALESVESHKGHCGKLDSPEAQCTCDIELEIPDDWYEEFGD